MSDFSEYLFASRESLAGPDSLRLLFSDSKHAFYSREGQHMCFSVL